MSPAGHGLSGSASRAADRKLRQIGQCQAIDCKVIRGSFRFFFSFWQMRYYTASPSRQKRLEYVLPRQFFGQLSLRDKEDCCNKVSLKGVDAKGKRMSRPSYVGRGAVVAKKHESCRAQGSDEHTYTRWISLEAGLLKCSKCLDIEFKFVYGSGASVHKLKQPTTRDVNDESCMVEKGAHLANDGTRHARLGL